MADENDKDAKTEDPTSRRLRKAREDGRVAKSAEVNTFFILLVSWLFFTFMGMWVIQNIMPIWHDLFMISGTYAMTPASLHLLFAWVADHLLSLLMPFLLSIAAVGVATNYWQNDGWMFSWKPLAPKFSKINPLTGWKKFLGKEGAMNLLKAIGKLSIIGTAVWIAMADEWEKVPILMELPLDQTLQMLGDELFWLVFRVLSALLVIAAIDLAYQRWSFKDNLKMTKQEVKDERKDVEGDPRIKQRIRNRQFEMFRQRMMQAVPEAEVVITNPTHLSIALRYDRTRDPAPIVVAKGAGHVAMRIREIAREHDIPLVEDKPLAQTLFKNVDIGEVIPETLYKAVAETLAYVYRLKKKFTAIN